MNRRTRSRLPLRLERLEGRDLQSVNGPSFDNLLVDATRYDLDNVIVAVRPGISSVNLAALGRPVAEATDYLGNHLYSIDLRAGVSVEYALAWFQRLPQVRYAQRDYMVTMARLPNDAAFSSQWGLHNTGQSGGTIDADSDAPDAWNVSTGSGRSIVAVIDSGVDYTHPDLAANMWVNSDEIAGNGYDDDRNGYIDDVRGWDFANNDNNPMDDNGHGTHVAGIIGAVGNNGVGVSGVNWRVQIMPLKFLGANGSGSLSNAIRALNYAVANGATVSNNSYGGGGFYQAFTDAVAAAGRAGHIFVAAAGNSSVNTDTSPSYPSSYNLDNIISVAATDRNDRLASFSNFGARTVDLAAPGVSIYSTLRGNSYGSMSGTSMAAPFVAGAVALVRDLHPDWTYRQVINQILNTADAIAALQGKTVTGGRLNVARALGSTLPVDSGGPSVTSATFSGATTGSFNRVRLTFSEAIDASTFTAADVVGLTRGGVAVSGVTFTVAAVAGTDNQFYVGFTTQSTQGTYALTVGPDIRDRSGNRMNQDGDATNGEAPGDRYTAVGTLSASQTFHSADVPRTIHDLARITSVLTINQDLIVSRISVKVNLSHTYAKDLRIYLQSPNGTIITLFDRRGGSGDNINTVFDDRATTPIGLGTAPFAGWHRPEQALAGLAGQNARGTWKLIVDDVAAFDTGRLNSWSLTFESGSVLLGASLEPHGRKAASGGMGF